VSQEGQIEVVADLEITSSSSGSRSQGDSDRATGSDADPVRWQIFTESASGRRNAFSEGDDGLTGVTESSASTPADRGSRSEVDAFSGPASGSSLSDAEHAPGEAWLVIEGPPRLSRAMVSQGIRSGWKFRKAFNRWIVATGQPVRVQSSRRVWLRAYPRPSLLGRALGMPGITIEVLNRRSGRG